MASLKALTLACVAALALTGVAKSADLLPPPPALEPLPPAPELGGWYLRGDVGVGATASTPNLVNTPDPIAIGGFSPAANQSFNNTTISASTMFDVGVGYQYNTWLRGDITVEYRGGAEFQSEYVLNDATTTTQYTDFYRANVSSLVGLANVYADLGTWSGITPYIGGGIGVARNTLSGFTDQGFGIVGGASTGPAGGYFGDGNKTNFAWALMAGFDFNVTQNLKLELGYRYLNLGKFTTGGSNCLNGTGAGGGFGNVNCSGGVANVVSSRGTLASNDVRIGLRWLIGETPAPQPEAPLVRKY